MFCILITSRRIYDLHKFPLRFINVSIMSLTKLSDFAGFKKVLDGSKNILVLTGAGVSAESGIPVFRGAGGLWRTYKATQLASRGAFERNPSLVWEFYHYRRNIAFNAQPNKAHIALAKLEEECASSQDRQFHIITQNVDGLHARAGSKNVIELHGSLNKVRCLNTSCNKVTENNEDPICPAFEGLGDPSLDAVSANLPMEDLPKCVGCGALVRPHIVWFGECLSSSMLNKSREVLQACDLCLVIGTSLMVYPAAEFAPMVADSGKVVAEFNLNEEPSKDNFLYHFPGPAGISVPKAFGYTTL